MTEKEEHEEEEEEEDRSVALMPLRVGITLLSRAGHMGSPILEAVLVKVGMTTLLVPEPVRGPLLEPGSGGWYVWSAYPRQPPLFDALGLAGGASR